MAVEGISPVTDKDPFDYYQQMPISGQANPSNQVKAGAGQGKEPLSPEDKQEVAYLKKRDVEVHQHEQAHLMVGGRYAKGGASYTYKTGPDGNRYAVGGEVQLDASPIDDDPQATISKMKTIKRAALAPADPSEQDYRVAALAEQQVVKARQDLAEQQTESTGQNGNQVDWTI